MLAKNWLVRFPSGIPLAICFDSSFMICSINRIVFYDKINCSAAKAKITTITHAKSFSIFIRIFVKDDF